MTKSGDSVSYKYIIKNVVNNYVEIKLNRADKLNSFNQQMSLELIDCLESVAKDDKVRGIVLTGAGKAFCAGQDLEEAISGKNTIDEIIEIQYNPIIKLIRNIEKPVVAAVNGVAAGAGANIALACDIVICSDNSSFIQAFSKIGLVPDSGGTYFLPRLIGMGKAAAIMMMGDKITAHDAERMNMVYEVVSNDMFQSRINQFMNKLAELPTRALVLTKKLLNSSWNNNLAEQLDMEKVLQKEAAKSYDYNEGVRAFLEKRNPTFEGK